MIGFLVWCFFLKLIHASGECGKVSPDSGQYAIIGDDSSDVTAPLIPCWILYTTATYITTLFRDNTTILQSNLETKTNVITGTYVEPSAAEPTVFIYTTFTYWTTSYDDAGSLSVTSREETLTNIVPASVT